MSNSELREFEGVFKRIVLPICSSLSENLPFLRVLGIVSELEQSYCLGFPEKISFQYENENGQLMMFGMIVLDETYDHVTLKVKPLNDEGEGCIVVTYAGAGYLIYYQPL